jgi:hypothetical protein
MRHIDVHEHEIGLVFQGQIERLAAVRGLGNDLEIPFVFQEHPQTLPEESLILSNEQLDGHRLRSPLEIQHRIARRSRGRLRHVPPHDGF